VPCLRAELKIGVAKAHNNLAQWQRPERTTPWVRNRKNSCALKGHNKNIMLQLKITHYETFFKTNSLGFANWFNQKRK
jgi:hypothetical protein